MEKKNFETETKLEDASKDYPGVAINEGDNNKDDEKLQKERTCTLGYNPRNQK